MTFFRSHITRFTSTCILFAGIVFYFINPAGDKIQHEAFTSWLQSNLKTQDDSAVLDQINELSSLDEELESVIRKASVLVQNNLGNFKLPVTKDRDENETFRLLLTEWNAFQNSNSGMSKALIIKNSKPHSVLPTDGLGYIGKAVAPQHTIIRLTESKSATEFLATADFHTSPLSGGSAINAP
ncbi:MAG: hypothetical protein WD059_02235 [Balneolaceae bacterium]